MASSDVLAHKLVGKHPLQRMESPSRGFSAFVHTLGFASFSYSFHYLVVTPSPINSSYGWHFQYLTIISLFRSTLTCILGLLSDLTLSRPLFSIKLSLSLTSSPLSLLITLLYWSLRTIDPRLVLPTFAPTPPILTDFSFHLFPFVFLLLDLLLLSPPYTIAFLPSSAVACAIAVVYWFWVQECERQNGFYPYPIFDHAGHWGRVGLFVMSAVVMTLATGGLKIVYGWANGWDVVGNGVKEREVRKERRGSGLVKEL